MREMRSFTSAEAGFTFFEVLVALAVLSFSGFILWTGFDGVLKAIEKIHNRNKIASELSRFEYLFRSEINQLGLSYWETEIDKYSGLYMENDSLYLDSGTGKILFSNLILMSLESKERGIEVIISTMESDEIRIFANYGSFSLKTGEYP